MHSRATICFGCPSLQPDVQEHKPVSVRRHERPDRLLFLPMTEKMLSSRTLGRKLLSVLNSADWEQKWTALQTLVSAKRLVSPLFSALFSTQENIHWRAVTCIGDTVCILADQSLESARVVMRRFMWSLNDESGGIGWGAPESMGEIMARHFVLAEEYGNILMSYIVPSDGPDNYLEYAPLRQGAYWGIARLAQAKPECVHPHQPDLEQALLGETDPKTLLFICLALTYLEGLSPQARSQVRNLTSREDHVRIYWNKDFSVVQLGAQALACLTRHQQHEP